METAKELGVKLDALIRLTAIGIVGDRTGADAIALLVKAGLETDVIAEVVGTTPATVRASRSRLRKKR